MLHYEFKRTPLRQIFWEFCKENGVLAVRYATDRSLLKIERYFLCKNCIRQGFHRDLIPEQILVDALDRGSIRSLWLLCDPDVPQMGRTSGGHRVRSPL